MISYANILTFLFFLFGHLSIQFQLNIEKKFFWDNLAVLPSCKLQNYFITVHTYHVSATEFELVDSVPNKHIVEVFSFIA